MTMADLEDDEDDVSDWSDQESVKVKKSGSRPKTRRSALQEESDRVMESDPKTSKLEAFTEADLIEAEARRQKLGDYLNRDEDEISVASIDLDDLDNDFIYIDGVDDPKSVVDGLLKAIPDLNTRPAVVPKVPDWLLNRLTAWDLRRDHVNICYDQKPKGRVVVAESVYDERVLLRKVSDPFNGFSESEAKSSEKNSLSEEIRVLESEQVENVCGLLLSPTEAAKKVNDEKLMRSLIELASGVQLPPSPESEGKFGFFVSRSICN